MKRIDRDPEKHDVLELFNSISQNKGLKLHDRESENDFLKCVSASLAKNKNTPTMVHGHRTEIMFGFILSSLGKCKLVKQEDKGEITSSSDNIQPPDYRVLLNDNSEYFIEVKNCHVIDKPFKITSKSFDNLSNYTNLFGKPLKFAIFWSRWNLWTLVSPEQLDFSGKKYSISLTKAMKVNEMNLVGDVTVGTTPPLVLRIETDEDKNRNIESSGMVKFSIKKIIMKCGNKIIDDELEANLAFNFMLYGRWVSREPVSIVNNNELIAYEFSSEPESFDENQIFSLLGSLSGMISQRFNQLTTLEGKIIQLSPAEEPGSLGIIIPDDYKGKYLPLWRFILEPNFTE